MEDTKPIASKDLLIEQLNTIDWENQWLSLMARTKTLLRYRYFLKWKNDKIVEFSRNIISEVLQKIFVDKTRNWNTESYPDFIEFLEGVLDSHINNTLKKQNKEITVDEDSIFINKSDFSNPERTLIGEELKNEIYQKVDQQGADDNELMVLTCMLDGIVLPREIRRELGISKAEFHNIWRRLNRKIENIKNEFLPNESN